MGSKHQNYLIVIVGPTAVGKTGFAVEMARRFGIPVINADSRQVYKEMNVGTAKPSKEEMEGVKHYFVGNKSLEEYYSAGVYESEVLDLLKEIFASQNKAILSGGSGLYIKAVCEGLDEMPKIEPRMRSSLKNEFLENGIDGLLLELQHKDPEFWEFVDKRNPQRILRALEVIRTTGNPYSGFRVRLPVKRFFSTIKIGLDRPRKELYARIDRRIDRMIESGLFEEAKSLKKYRHCNALQTVGYREIFGYFDGEYDKKETVRLLKRNSRRYAKRQLTWFGRDPEVIWFHPEEPDKVVNHIMEKTN